MKKTYKQLIKQIITIKTNTDLNEASGAISDSFNAEKITWQDYEDLQTLLKIIYTGINNNE